MDLILLILSKNNEPKAQVLQQESIRNFAIKEELRRIISQPQIASDSNTQFHDKTVAFKNTISITVMYNDL